MRMVAGQKTERRHATHPLIAAGEFLRLIMLIVLALIMLIVIFTMLIVILIVLIVIAMYETGSKN
jgi:lipopolysaccharide/colanic/teichoic acid biosynthesis glycosyltransferase